MQAGILRHRITLQSPINVPDGFGGFTVSWEDEFNAWADIDPPKGREYFAAGEKQTEITTRVRVRYRAGIKGSWRVKFGKRIFDINSIIDPDERHRELILMCVENVV